MDKNTLEILSGMPFLLSNGSGVKVNYARIIEAVIIACLGGFLAAQITISELKSKLIYLEHQNARQELTLNKVCDAVTANSRDNARQDANIDSLMRQVERNKRDR